MTKTDKPIEFRDRRLLHLLRSDEFVVSAGTINTPQSLRRWLGRNELVGALDRAIVAGSVSEQQIESFVSELMDDFVRGVQFPHEYALGAIAVAIARRPTAFATEYLSKLAALTCVEMYLAPRLAKLIIDERANMPQTKVRSYRLCSRLRPFAAACLTLPFVASVSTVDISAGPAWHFDMGHGNASA